MKVIVHIDLTGTYNEEMNYQENMLPRENYKAGNKVYFIGTCFRWENGNEMYTAPGKTLLSDGVILYRLPYKRIFSKYDKKIRSVENIYDILNELNPDIIMLHCLQALAYIDVVKYVNKHPYVRLVADSHTDVNNSANGFISRWILHELFYKAIAKRIYKHAECIYYISAECKDFLTGIYGLSERKLEYLPLGGIFFEDFEYLRYRTEFRRKLCVKEGDILLFHSGKFDMLKKTIELLKAFHEIDNDSLRLVLAGTFADEIKQEAINIIDNDKRIQYIGWQSGTDLLKYLCAADVYMQPGSQSATMQQAACCRCVLVLYPYKSHIMLFENSVI